MKDYYNEFIKLSLQQCTKNDYTNKAKVKAHNVASKKLQQLQNEMKKIDCAGTLNMLLFHEDERVKVNAVSLCLQLGINTEKAVHVLENIIATSDDATICFSSKMILKSIY